MSDDDWRRSRKSRGRKGAAEHDFPPDGSWSSPASASPSSGYKGTREPQQLGSESGAVVKRFDAGRGFGFVELDSGGDAFLHVSILQRVGTDFVAPGARLRVRWSEGQKGPQVVEVLEVEGGDGASSGQRGLPALSSARRNVAAQQPAGASGLASGSDSEVRGTVKWYSADKGFGFITPEGGGRDVFVHATALERSGMPPLTDGQLVTVRVTQGKKGLEAEEIRAVELGP